MKTCLESPQTQKVNQLTTSQDYNWDHSCDLGSEMRFL